MNGTAIYNAGRANSLTTTADFKGINDYYKKYAATYYADGAVNQEEVEGGMANAWAVYGQSFELAKDAYGNTMETVTVNGAPATIGYTLAADGTIIIEANNANVTGDIVFTVPVVMSHMYSGYNPQVVNAQVVFKVQ